jgi:hypothetical protein
MSEQIDLKGLSYADLSALMKKKREEEHQSRLMKRDAYEGIRGEVIKRIEDKVRAVGYDVKELFTFVKNETSAFYDVMSEYGELRREGQMSFKIQSEAFRVEVKSYRVKKFDERADIAATRLVKFLREWIKVSQYGTNNPMYQLAMLLLERNQQGDLDYKSVSKLYDLESQFNNVEYSEIMQLFKESNVVESTAVNYYFYECTELGVWKKIEVSFNRL